MPGGQVAACMIPVKTDDPGNRISVDMHVHGAHKNRDLDAAVFEIFRFFNLFDHHDLSISRRNDMVFIDRCMTIRVSEKLKNQNKKSEGEYHKDGAQYLTMRENVLGTID